MIGTEELNEQAISKPEEAAELIKKYDYIIRVKRKGIISVAYHEGGKCLVGFERMKSLSGWLHKGTIILECIRGL